MNTPTTSLTLWVDPQETENRKGSGTRSLTYPTRDELLVRGVKMRGTPAERLARAYVIEPNGCWRWIKGRTSSGYGHFSIRGIYYQAHLLTYVLHVGPIPADLEPDHKCRNRWCVNPADIEFVTHAVNVQRGGQTTLSQAQVDEIRLSRRTGESYRALGRRFGVDHAQILRIVRGTSWRPEPIERAAVA